MSQIKFLTFLPSCIPWPVFPISVNGTFTLSCWDSKLWSYPWPFLVFHMIQPISNFCCLHLGNIYQIWPLVTSFTTMTINAFLDLFKDLVIGLSAFIFASPRHLATYFPQSSQSYSLKISQIMSLTCSKFPGSFSSHLEKNPKSLLPSKTPHELAPPTLLSTTSSLLTKHQQCLLTSLWFLEGSQDVPSHRAFTLPVRSAWNVLFLTSALLEYYLLRESSDCPI